MFKCLQTRRGGDGGASHMYSRGIAQIEQRLLLDGWVDILLQLIPQMNNIKPCGFKCGGNTIATLR